MKRQKLSRSERYRKRVAIKSLHYKGAECIVCGYDKCREALDFHHVEPNEKKSRISEMFSRHKSWHKIKEELDKCILLCKCCHAEYHYGYLKITQEHLERNPSPEEGEQNIKKIEFDSSIRKRVSMQKIENTCDNCNIIVSKGAKFCHNCHNSNRETKISWPCIEELAKEVKKKNFSKVARELGVSDNAIRKRFKNHSDINPKDLV